MRVGENELDIGEDVTVRYFAPEFTLDHSMLVFASEARPGRRRPAPRIAGVDGVSVHSYRFPKPGMYDSELLNSVREQIPRGRVEASGKHPRQGWGSGATDLWIRFENKAIRNVAVLFAGQKQLNLIAVSGSISPLDLVHLGGHFGIPRIEGGVRRPRAWCRPVTRLSQRVLAVESWSDGLTMTSLPRISNNPGALGPERS